MNTVGEGRYKVWLKEEMVGDDRVYILGGGEQSHIGGAVFMSPGIDEPVVIRLGEHHDYVVLEPIAQEACKKYNTTVVAVGGIHIDDATKDEIDKIVENCKELLKCI
jgi:tetrahydromethanopterin S-methyltransferase subunit A